MPDVVELPDAAARIAQRPAGFSLEVTPRTASKIPDFRPLMPTGTQIYVAHIAGTDISDMVATARRLKNEGFVPTPHIPARWLRDQEQLREWLLRYRDEAGVGRALLLGGGARTPAGKFDSSIQMIETGLFDQLGYRHLYVAGHPEGNRDIDPDGGTQNLDAALAWKTSYTERTDAVMAIVTQFMFSAPSLLSWIRRVRSLGVTLPIHVGLAGPAKLHTLLRYALACGIGPSLQVLQKRASDMSKMLLPYTPADVFTALMHAVDNEPGLGIERFHFFPLGGIEACLEWIKRNAVSGEVTIEMPAEAAARSTFLPK